MLFFTPRENHYQIQDYILNGFMQAFQRMGIECHSITIDWDNVDALLQFILEKNPDCTFAINGLLPNADGEFLADFLQIPHIAYMIDSPLFHMPLISSNYTLITGVDDYFCRLLRGWGAPRVHFSPHAVDQKDCIETNEERIYEVLIPSSFIDYQAIYEQWKQEYSAEFFRLLEKAIQLSFKDLSISYIQAVSDMYESYYRTRGEPLQSAHLLKLLKEVEYYMRGVDRIELINSLDESIETHIIGENFDLIHLTPYLRRSSSNLFFHAPSPYIDTLNLMRKSKVVINSTPTFKEGGHERLFASLACGALPLTNDNLFIHKYFREGEDLLIYKPGQRAECNRLLKIYLEDEDRRKKAIYKGYDKVLKGHLLDNRAQSLLNTAQFLFP